MVPPHQPEHSSPFSVLTPRERDVMQYVARGKPNKIIAAELGVSQRTIEAHRARIFQKMQVRNAVELAHRVLSNGRLS
ncbi:response regulator transcription factor [Parapusillimonas granuli]|uniref:Response regulator transcription factor n=1 Tax=Parapusillimonas granuli TaxID=380911 RepID=A0A853FZ24_9BURK|nr:response regulator transcription factor [Parapusillimonas granuli]MBB5214680.1 DNA-binding NarL/FixJ family response regulator [Parapusillimonas granuli]MEB2398072.1 response regulator transcription factor [Alcaligenaceae bacterium]NYT48912.1 response regulator transcription factor [Parapusillimonas granuli]